MSDRTIALRGTSYDLRWLTADGIDRDWSRLRQPDLPYSDCLQPLYNLHQDVGPEVAGAPEGDWPAFWRRRGREVAAQVDRWGIVAVVDGAVAGMIRFFPKPLTVPRAAAWSAAEHAAADEPECLWIGAAAVDDRAAGDGLEHVLATQAVAHARSAGFLRVQALAWPEVRPYALWGQGFTVGLYSSLAFGIVTATAGCREAFVDMAEGRHGEAIAQRVARAVAAGLDRAEGHRCWIVERAVL